MITHSAPPVVYPLGRSRFQALLLAGLWAAGCASIVLWLFSGQQAVWHVVLSVTAFSGAGLAAFIGGKNTKAGQVVWDGQHWRWEVPVYQSGIAEHRVSVMADFQSLLLLRIQSDTQKSMCVWCERSAFPERWLDFRRALFSPGRHSGIGYAVAVSGHADAAPLSIKP